MMNKSFIKENLAVGFMLLALFLGAGNIIFPPELGQQSGDQFIISIIGFLITGVGLPLLGIIAVARNGGDLQLMAGRINPVFAFVFTTIVYLSIGPFFAMPRTGAVSYEIGVLPYLTSGQAESWVPLFLTTLVFFAVTFFLAYNPTKIVDNVGKLLTPALLLVIILLAAKAFITPMGEFGEATGNYVNNGFAEGFIQGYLTLDVLASLVFGIVIVQGLRARGVEDKKQQVKITMFAGIVAAIGLAFVYIVLGYIGASSVGTVGMLENGGLILGAAAKVLYGDLGTAILSATIILACLTTSVGLLVANAQFFERNVPILSYRGYLIVFTLFSFGVSNVGLSTLLDITLPVLLAIYPIAIVLMIVALFAGIFNHARIIYVLPLIATFFVAINDGLKGFGIEIGWYNDLLNMLPLQEQSLGWLVPAVVMVVIGIVISLLTKKENVGALSNKEDLSKGSLKFNFLDN